MDPELSALLVPNANASLDEWAREFPISRLPPLQTRSEEYFAEPWGGICTVGIMSAVLVWMTVGVSTTGPAAHTSLAHLMVTLIWIWAAIAALCTAFILFGNAGVVKRSHETCYPIPHEVAERLISGKSLESRHNINDPNGSGRVYCVRCLVWRPEREQGGKSHHCSTCQRCVTGFDHHCGVFGRCIVDGNMPCFVGVISMMFAGWMTTAFAFFSGADMDERSFGSRPYPYTRGGYAAALAAVNHTIATVAPSLLPTVAPVVSTVVPVVSAFATFVGPPTLAPVIAANATSLLIP